MSEFDDDDRVRDALEARLVQEEIEAAAEQLHRNTRTVGELLLDWADAGYHVRIEVGARMWSGAVVGVVEDGGVGLVALRTADSYVEIDLQAVRLIAQLRERIDVPAQLAGWLPSSLLARLRWLTAQDPRPNVTLGGAGAEPIRGVIVSAGESHVEVERPDGVVVVPNSAWVFISWDEKSGIAEVGR